MITCYHGRPNGYLCPHCHGFNGAASRAVVTINTDVTAAATSSVTMTYYRGQSGANATVSSRKRTGRPDPHPTDVKREQRQKMLADARKFRA